MDSRPMNFTNRRRCEVRINPDGSRASDGFAGGGYSLATFPSADAFTAEVGLHALPLALLYLGIIYFFAVVLGRFQ